MIKNGYDRFTQQCVYIISKPLFPITSDKLSISQRPAGGADTKMWKLYIMYRGALNPF